MPLEEGQKKCHIFQSYSIHSAIVTGNEFHGKGGGGSVCKTVVSGDRQTETERDQCSLNYLRICANNTTKTSGHQTPLPLMLILIKSWNVIL